MTTHSVQSRRPFSMFASGLGLVVWQRAQVRAAVQAACRPGDSAGIAADAAISYRSVCLLPW
ncbi:hypothetical protein [Verrucosispora sp. TAA-831]|uniref:hypothetical protein n=1 Tax=Verrucosispora sp. TAA-831 TaxID=3422227 RepID=UPI003D700205